MKHIKTAVAIGVAALILATVFFIIRDVMADKRPDSEKVTDMQDDIRASTTTIKIKGSGSSDIEINTSAIEVLGIGDLKSNFDRAYGKPKQVDGEFEYLFVAGTISVIYAPDVNQKDRAWQITIKQRPSSYKTASELALKFMPKDAKRVGSTDLGVEAKEINYKSETLAGLFEPDIFMNKVGSIDAGFFRLRYDIDDSNLVYQTQLLGGSFEF